MASGRDASPLGSCFLGCLLVASLVGCEPDAPPAGPRDGGGPALDAAACSGGTVACTGGCVDLQSDVRSCGQCDRACAAGEVCWAGVCTAGGCGGGTTDCGGSCVDLASSSSHCGSCGHACPTGATCTAGECTCAGGLTACGASCVDTARDEASCGSCGHACGAGESCIDGLCAACGVGVSFSRDVQPIFTATCTDAACHAGARPASDLSLEAGSAHGELVGMASSCMDGRPLVTPGDVAASYLVNKIEGRSLCGGNQMPLGRGSLSAAQIELVREWICGGARDD